MITAAELYDARYDLPDGAGTDAVHTDPQYGYAVTLLKTDGPLTGTGITYTLGGGTNLICEAIRLLIEPLLGRDIEELMADFGQVQRGLAEHHQLRWLGPHKGVTHAALSSITNACFDLWAKTRNVPLWQLLLDLSPEQLVNVIDLSYLEDVLTREEAIGILQSRCASRCEREAVLRDGYPGYDTSVGWFQFSDEKICENAKRAIDAGFTAMKLKVGAADPADDFRRVNRVRDTVGTDALIMLDANQAWSLPKALDACRELAILHRGTDPARRRGGASQAGPRNRAHSDCRWRSGCQPRDLEKLPRSGRCGNCAGRLHAVGGHQ